MSEPNGPNEFALVSRTLGGLPIVNAVLARLGLPALLALDQRLTVNDTVKIPTCVKVKFPTLSVGGFQVG